MRSCGIKNIFYSIPEGIVCERVSNIISINSSSVSRLIEREHYNAPEDDTEYYTNLLIRKFPNNVKKKNLENFLNHNIKNVLPYFSWKIKNNKITFYNNNNIVILCSNIY